MSNESERRASIFHKFIDFLLTLVTEIVVYLCYGKRYLRVIDDAERQKIACARGKMLIQER